MDFWGVLKKGNENETSVWLLAVTSVQRGDNDDNDVDDGDDKFFPSDGLSLPLLFENGQLRSLDVVACATRVTFPT